MGNRFGVIAPIERFVAPHSLDGSDGANRAFSSSAQISATNDIEAVNAWLAMFVDTATTFASYRKEAERLLLWSTLQLQKPLSSLSHEDWLVYRSFLADPQPRERWVSGSPRKFPRSDPRWRPFAGSLSPASQRQACVILNAMFSWLVTAGYLAGNPLSLSRERRRAPPARMTRYLDEHLWREVMATVELLPVETARQIEHQTRMRWLMSLFYLCGLRISEISGATMGGFFERRDRTGRSQWWLEVAGKGEKIRIIPATTELMAELALYRGGHRLPHFPMQGETTPLLLPIGGAHRALTRGAIHAIVKALFTATASRLRAAGTGDTGDVRKIEAASAHWLRHTAGSHMADNQIDLRHVRDNLGHQSLSTTNIYLHSEDDARHQETDTKHRIGWKRT